VLDPQTMMSMGVESFTEERTGSARAVGLYVLVVDVTCVKSLWSSYGVISPDSPSRGCQGEWMFLRGVVSPDSPSRCSKEEWIILLEETTCVADARDVRGSGVVSLMRVL